MDTSNGKFGHQLKFPTDHVLGADSAALKTVRDTVGRLGSTRPDAVSRDEVWPKRTIWDRAKAVTEDDFITQDDVDSLKRACFDSKDICGLALKLYNSGGGRWDH